MRTITNKTMTKFRVFTRTWWTENPSWPNGLEPEPGEKKYFATASTEEEARAIAREYNATHDPGRYSEKAEFESV